MARFIARFALAVAACGCCWALSADDAAAEPDRLPAFARPGFALAVGSGQPSIAEPIAQPASDLKPVAVPSPAAAVAPPVSPQPQAKPAPAFPTTVPEAKAREAAKAAAPEVWPQQEIEVAKARCTQLLKGLDIVAVPEEPLREGECGTPAPVRLISIGRKPEITFSPPALVTCDLAVGLHTWLKKELQPLARKHLGSEIVRVETMSDYSCRNAYGRVKTRLSEHGRANALDIRGFVTAKADVVAVIDNWGTTQRELIALAKEKAKAEARATAAAHAAEATKPTGPSRPAQPAAAHEMARGTIVDGLPQPSIGLPGLGGHVEAPATIGFGMARLGGPKPAEAAKIPQRQVIPATAPAATDPSEARKTFLHEAHTSACRIFGTVLGPEANNAHRNHFHVDMAERQTGAFCE